MIDALLLCAGNGGPSRLGAALKAAAGATEIDAEIATRISERALPTLAHAAAPDCALPDAILTLTGTEARVSRAMCTLLAQVSGDIDRDRTTVLVTRRHAVLPGRDVIRLFFGLRRLERLSLEAFHDYWLNRHADIGRRLIPPYTYHQLHSDPVATGRLCSATGLAPSSLDGVVEVHFPDIIAFVAQLSRPEVAEKALADERNFIDHQRSIFWAYQTL